MSTMQLILWWSLIFLGVVGSAIYSGLETGIYRLNRIRLHIRVQNNEHAAIKLKQLISKPTSLLSTLLIGNNLMNYLGTGGLAIILRNYQWSEGRMIIANFLLITPLLFVFGETLPKDIFARFSDQLMYRFTGLLLFSQWVFTATGILPLVQLFSNISAKWLHTKPPIMAFHPRRQLGNIMRESVGHGLLSDEQSALVQRILALHQRTLKDELTPWDKVVKIHSSATTSHIRQLAGRNSFSRYPMIDEQQKVLGYVRVDDVLKLSIDETQLAESLRLPLIFLDITTPSRVALAQLQTDDQPMAAVMQGEKMIGIVTLKDLVEPITGELASW